MSDEKQDERPAFKLHWMHGVGALLLIIGIMGAANGAAIGYVWLLLAVLLLIGGTVVRAIQRR